MGRNVGFVVDVVVVDFSASSEGLNIEVSPPHRDEGAGGEGRRRWGGGGMLPEQASELEIS